MLWVLIRSASARASNEYPQRMFSWRNKKDINIFRMKKAPYLLLCLAIQNMSSEDSHQTAQMHRLKWIFDGCTRLKVCFLTLSFIWWHNSCLMALIIFVPFPREWEKRDKELEDERKEGNRQGWGFWGYKASVFLHVFLCLRESLPYNFSPSGNIKFIFQFFFTLCPYPSNLGLKYCIFLHVFLFENYFIFSIQAFSHFYFYSYLPSAAF